ncbi:asparagine synthetase B [Microbispora sp. RL4-1S]|uniref:asparagine synthase (glutamine-hydrolyzing) n=1 Tax=Microbispora oryzae TaxID=2806554 RepID=A0A940WTL3_9ACTN|nr:asparagine synthase-related protein [Microbispora oryzae]MBP2706881.1 asparagine synthetase B [Microbispora oryzae]
MGGITGWVQFDRDLSGPAPVLAAMTAALAPGENLGWIGERVALGCRSPAGSSGQAGGGRQGPERPGGPAVAVTAQGTVAVVFAGSLDGAAGCADGVARSRPAETVLAAYLDGGTDAARRLDGVFAFAVWDGRAGELVLARDRLGGRPLYVYPVGGGMVFGSAPGAILAHPSARAVVDLDGLRRMLAFTLCLPGTPWDGMTEVTPGTALTVSAAGVAERRYWKLTAREHTGDVGATVAAVGDLLRDSVRRRPAASALLSGGLDSSTLVAMAGRNGRRPVRTFELDFGDYADHFTPDAERAAPDAPYAAEVAAHLGTDHRRIVLTGRDVGAAELRAAVVRAYGQPPGWGDRDRSAVLLYRAARAAREVSATLLSGEGADELFCGYADFHDPRYHRAGTFSWVAFHFGAYSPDPDALAPGLAARLRLWDHLAERYAEAAAEVEHPDGADESERRLRVLAHLYITRSLRVLLDRVDRLSGAAGVTLRLPYCDHRLVEYVYNVPWAVKTFDGREKSLLRAVGRPLLPPSVPERVKTAYPSIRHPGFDAALRREAAALAADHGHPAFAVVRRSWLEGVGRDAAPLAPRTRNTVEWALNLASWLEEFRPTLRLP